MRTLSSRIAMLCALLGCACALAADKPDAARLVEARALMGAMQLERQIDAMSKSMSASMSQTLAAYGTPATARINEISMAESMALMKEQATRPGGLFDLVAELYAEKFSVDELRQIRAFYESPVGQRFLQTSPELMQRVMQQSASLNRDIVPRVCNRVKARLMAENIPEGNAMTCPALP